MRLYNKCLEKVKNQIPNFITLLNMLCGAGAIYCRDDTVTAVRLILMGILFDCYDGAVARMLKSTSKLGGQLDSIGDIITFAIAPISLIPWDRYQYVKLAYLIQAVAREFQTTKTPLGNYIGLISPFAAGIPLCLLSLSNSINMYAVALLVVTPLMSPFWKCHYPHERLIETNRPDKKLLHLLGAFLLFGNVYPLYTIFWLGYFSFYVLRREWFREISDPSD